MVRDHEWHREHRSYPRASGYHYEARAGTPASKPASHMAWAITTAFLFWPLAVPAIVFAAQVGPAWDAGDAASAHEGSRKARLFSALATAAFLVCAAVALLR